jgi:hypothetical protein
MDEVRYLSECSGKVPFESRALALSVCKRPRRHIVNREPYKCDFCGFWHVGSKIGKLVKRHA